MELKKVYDIPEGWQREYEGLAAFEALLAKSPLSPEQQAIQVTTFKQSARLLNIPPQIGLEVINTGSTPFQNWGRDFVEQGLKGGWVSIGRTVLTLHTQNQGDFSFKILRVPGTYCCHCETQLEDDPTGRTGRDHVRGQHEGQASPDPSNPLGFRYTNAYECELEATQHAQWNYHAVRATKENQSAPQPTVEARQKPETPAVSAPPSPAA